ncbi:ester cyclase [Marivita sp. GX14005]|uniref:nuclear transport factor 2 family protein n=1 Tax=Marivita sp. GX14005 TaxID=2942276 RepID=UPI00201959B8|nr:ester cyclase [Marivita sp. GX14005]MCL3881563.1 ester cyclase [Marivita sp. GX14005]
MPDFDDRWADAPDFVLGITKDIWEDRGIDTLLRYYGPDLVVRSPASVIKGNAGIIAATKATLAEFPDRELLGEDVIWCQTGEGSFLSSHRLYCTATHEGAGMYGAPTGRRLAYRILADCWCAANGVHDEWLVRDQGAIVRQMGQQPEDWTRALIAREGGPEHCVKPMTPATDMPGPYRGWGHDNSWGYQLAELLTRIAQAEFSCIPAHYDRAAELAYPGHVDANGHDGADRFWMALHAAFPDATFEIDHVMGMNEPLSPPRAAVRWSMLGKHAGWGMFGTPSGAEVYIIGITHAEFGPRGLRREWTLIDETAIWKQILLATGRV